MALHVERKTAANDEGTKREYTWNGFSGLTHGNEYVIKGHVTTYGLVVNKEFYHVENDWGEIIVVPAFYFKYTTGEVVDYNANRDFEMRAIPTSFL